MKGQSSGPRIDGPPCSRGEIGSRCTRRQLHLPRSVDGRGPVFSPAGRQPGGADRSPIDHDRGPHGSRTGRIARRPEDLIPRGGSERLPEARWEGSAVAVASASRDGPCACPADLHGPARGDQPHRAEDRRRHLTLNSSVLARATTSSGSAQVTTRAPRHGRGISAIEHVLARRARQPARSAARVRRAFVRERSASPTVCRRGRQAPPTLPATRPGRASEERRGPENRCASFVTQTPESASAHRRKRQKNLGLRSDAATFD